MLLTGRISRFQYTPVTKLSRHESSLVSFNDKESEEHRDPEKECFMCRQANIYSNPIGMQQERRVARRHPPTLTRAQIEELGKKKGLTKREARQLLQCYFPEIKKVKYFQLHKYHSCCYDPKHLNLCKNHITALQHEHEYEQHEHFSSISDNAHYKPYERDDGYQNRVSFVRIKIEPNKGIPTRYLAPAALPESLADMLVKQVNRYEHKKKQPTLELPPVKVNQRRNTSILETIPDYAVSSFSERLGTLGSDDDDDDDDDNNYLNSDADSNEDEDRNHTNSSGIRGYYGNIMGHSRVKYEEKILVRQEREKERVKQKVKEKPLRINTNKDIIVEDVEDLDGLFVDEQKPTPVEKPIQPLKKKKRKKRAKKRTHTHRSPKLNHWELMALEQSKKETCGCRHHVQRLEANQIVYDWCRCKDHRHKELKDKLRTEPAPTPEKPKERTPTPKLPKIETKTTGTNTTESETTEIALAYDPSAVDYDVIQEAIYYRTSSGRMVKPEVTNSFNYENLISSSGLNRPQRITSKSDVVLLTVKNQLEPTTDDQRSRKRSSVLPTILSARLERSRQTPIDTEVASINSETDKVAPITKTTIVSPEKTSELYGDDDDNEDESIETFSPKPVQEAPVTSPVRASLTPMSSQRSSKPIYIDKRATPNYDNQSSITMNRRWFDQPLGDENLLPVQDGRYGLIAGTSTENYVLNSQLPDNDYAEPYRHKNRSNCTIS